MVSFSQTQSLNAFSPARLARRVTHDAARELTAERLAVAGAARRLRLALAAARSGVAALVVVGGVVCMASAFCEIAAGPAAPPVAAMARVAATAAEAEPAPGAASLSREADGARQWAWAKFFAGLYASAFVALGLYARVSEA